MSSDNWGEGSQEPAAEDLDAGAVEQDATEVRAVETDALDIVTEEDAVRAAELEEVESSDDETSLEDDIMVLEDGVSPDLPDAVLPVWEPTGNPAVDAALEDLHALADIDVTEHAAVYERVQSSLRATLDGLVAEDEPAS